MGGRRNRWHTVLVVEYSACGLGEHCLLRNLIAAVEACFVGETTTPPEVEARDDATLVVSHRLSVDFRRVIDRLALWCRACRFVVYFDVWERLSVSFNRWFIHVDTRYVYAPDVDRWIPFPSASESSVPETRGSMAVLPVDETVKEMYDLWASLASPDYPVKVQVVGQYPTYLCGFITEYDRVTFMIETDDKWEYETRLLRMVTDNGSRCRHVWKMKANVTVTKLSYKGQIVDVVVRDNLHEFRTLDFFPELYRNAFHYDEDGALVTTTLMPLALARVAQMTPAERSELPDAWTPPQTCFAEVPILDEDMFSAKKYKSIAYNRIVIPSLREMCLVTKTAATVVLPYGQNCGIFAC